MMKERQHRRPFLASSPISFRNGRIYFSAGLERKVFFRLTMAMLLYGVLLKLEIL